MIVRPLSDWLVVKCDKFQDRSQVIIAPNNNESRIRTGTVLEVGPGRRLLKADGRKPIGVEKGEKIAFLRWHEEHRPGKAVAAALQDLSDLLNADVCMIRQADILFAFTGDVHVDVP